MSSKRESVLLQAAMRILRPVVRQMLRHGIGYRAFSDLVKRTYFRVAAEDFSLPDRPQTDSRIALITGLSRREVAALRRERRRPPGPALDPGLATKLVGVWVNDPRYHTEGGEPLALPVERKKGKGPSFAELVRRVGGDIPPRALLDELTRVGCVEVRATRTVHLLQTAYIPAADSPERIEMMGEDIEEFARVIAHNLESAPHEAFLPQKVVYDNVGSEGIDGLRAELRRLGEAFLRRVNKLVASHDRDRNPRAPGGERKRVVLGVYDSQDDGEDGT